MVSLAPIFCFHLMRFSSEEPLERSTPRVPDSHPRRKNGKPSVSSRTPLAKSFAAVPDATLAFLLGHPAGFDGERTRHEFLKWATEQGRTNDTDWRFAWPYFVQTHSKEPVAAVPARSSPRLIKQANGGFKISCIPKDTAVAVPNEKPPPPEKPNLDHPWAARLRPKLAA